MIDIREIVGAFLVLFAIIDITGSIPIFLSLKHSGNKYNPLYAALISLLIFVIFFFLGDAALKLFGVDIQSFAVAGSIVLFIMAFEMILGVEIFKNEAGDGGSTVVPIAFPLIAGPGALTTIISLRAEYADVNILIALLVNIIIDYFNRMVQELSGMETLRTDFIANVSHELKTPLAVIQNYGAMLQQPNLSYEDRKDYARTVTNASQRLASLITNILKLNKLENQQIFPKKERFDLGEQLCECLLGFENAWEAKNLEIETDIEDDVTVESDPELLSLVWNNLFSNAIKFTEEGGTIGLKLHIENEHAVVEVSDTGCGISPEVGAHIFEKFYQGDTSHATQGNGLGLALVKRVVDIIDGEISVSSELGKGSTFTVRIKAV